VPREPAAEAWKTLVAIGPMARTVADARLLLGVIAGADVRDPHSVGVIGFDQPSAAPSALRVVASEDLGFAALDDDVRRVFRHAVGRLAAAGATVLDDRPGRQSSIRIWATIAAVEARREEHHTYDHQRDLLTHRAAHFLEFGGRLTADDYAAAQAERPRIRAAYEAMFDRTGASVLLTPTLGLEAFPHGSTHPGAIGGEPIHPLWMDWAPLLYDANLCGFPALSVPMGLGDDGLPLGLQVLGLPGHDGAVLAAAEAVEALLGLDLRPPEAALTGLAAA
jgi:Asp-tRNA(Asn)/Glu-tRNA(Gln) amidotransferase A subunit family amidase